MMTGRGSILRREYFSCAAWFLTHTDNRIASPRPGLPWREPMVALKNFLVLLRCSIVASALVSSTDLCAAGIMLLEFGSASCAPCQDMRAVVQRLAAAGYHVRYVDIARESALAAQFKVDQVPTFVALIDGREHARMVGTGTYE